MKLYLSSWGIKNPSELYKLLGKSKNIKTALITNAIDLKTPEARKVRYDSIQGGLSKLPLDITDIDLNNYVNNTQQLKSDLLKYDFLWVPGGNVFYLRQMFKRSGLDRALKDIVEAGVVYGGDSAGALVIGPTLRGFEKADSIEKIQDVIYNGTNLINFVPLPHWGNEKFQSILEEIRTEYNKKELDLKIINDDQAIIVDGNQIKIVDADIF